MLRAADFHIKRSRSVTRKVALRIGSTLGGRLPDEQYYFDELVRALNLDRISVGVKAMESINAAVFAERVRIESRLLELVRDEKLVGELVSKIDVIDTSSLNAYVLFGRDKALVCEIGDGRLVIITKEAKSAEQLVSLVRKELARISKRSAFSGYVLDRFVSGTGLVESYLASRSDILAVSKGKRKSPFEKIVHAEVERIVDSYMQNVVIKFRGSGETEEYDFLVVLGPDVAFDVEVTDYSLVSAEIDRIKKNTPFLKPTLKSTVLVRCQQKAKRIETKAVLVAKGFPAAIHKDLDRIAREIGVIFLDEHDIGSRIEDILIQATIAATTSRTPLRSPREFSEAIRHGKFEL